MKRPSYIYILEILLFFVLLAGAFLVLSPVSKKLDAGLSDMRKFALEKLENETGLSFSYGSLSPSILRSLKFKDVIVRDAASGQVIARISEMSVAYSLGELLSGNIPGALRDIVLKNGSISIDTESNRSVFEHFASLARGSSGQTQKTRDTVRKNPESSVQVRLSNISVAFHDKDLAVFGLVNKGFLSVGGEELSFSLGGKILVNHPTFFLSSSTSSAVELNGSFGRSLDSGTATLVFRSFQSGRISIDRLGLVTSFRNGIVTVNSAGSLQPVDINLVWNIAQESVKGTFECEKLFPLKWIRVRDLQEVLPAGLENMILSGSASIAFGKNSEPSYTIDFDAQLPPAVDGGGRAVVACTGNLENVDFSRLSIVDSKYDVSYKGSLNLVKLIPDGYLSAKKVQLTRGCVLSGDMRVQPDKKGFVCHVPELRVNDSTFSSVDLSVVPAKGQLGLSLSAYDTTGPGHISADGSYSFEKGSFLQLYVAFDSVSFSNTAIIVAQVISPDTDFSGIARTLNPFAMTTEIYLSTDFDGISFSCTKLVLASAEKNGLYLILSAKGNGNGVDFTNITFSRNGYDITGNISSSFETGGILFNSNFVVNSIPYAASGSWVDNVLSIYGDYGLALSAFFDKDGKISGSFASRELPVPVGPLLVSLSVDSSFTYASASDWKLLVSDGSIEEMKNVLPLPTLVAFSAEADPSGVSFTNLSVSDTLSHLTGHASFSILPDNTYRTELLLAADETKESFDIHGTVSFADGIHFDTKMNLVNVPLMRFVKGQQPSSLVSLSLAASGTPEDPTIHANVRSLVWRLGDFDLSGQGGFYLEKGVASLVDATATWNGNTFSGLNATVPFDTFKTHVVSDYATTLGNSGLTAKLAFDFVPDTTIQRAGFDNLSSLLDRYSITSSVSDVHWKSFVLSEPFVSSFVHEPGVTAVYAGKDDAITGFLLDDGTFSLQSGASLPVTFHADGEVLHSNLAIRVDGFSTDLAVLWPLFGISAAEFTQGKLEGNFVISGLVNDPEFHGTIHATGISVRAPGLLAGTYGPAAFDIIAEGKTLTVPEFTLTGKDGAVTSSCTVVFDRWIPTNVVVRAGTPAGKFVKILADNPYFKASGYSAFNLVLSITPDIVTIDGSANYERGSFAVLFSSFASQGKSSPGGGGMDYKLNLDLDFGKKVEFRWPTDDIPIIRGLVQADNPFNITMDTKTGTFGVKGTANLKGGEIFYIKRSFYLRKGTITFNENQDRFDPMITVRAEIRERDEDGDPVKILLAVENQPLSTFTPVLSSDPPKSDLELMALLGQATSADASQKTILKDTVVTASDLLTQISLFRSAENALRDLLGLDIFSIRTLIIQNAIFGPTMQATADKSMTVGNYFDNTTVYMGKYLGSAIYADALMHFSYYNPLTAVNTGTAQAVYQNLLFQPELGLEVATPFCLVRWSIAPAHPDTLFVADNSITLSWKFSY